MTVEEQRDEIRRLTDKIKAQKEEMQDIKEQIQATNAEIFEQVREYRKRWEGTGRYVLLPTEALVKRAEVYYNQHFDNVVTLLKSSGIDGETIEGVLQDYVAILTGLNIQLPLSKQVEIVNSVKPVRMYLTERYGLHILFAYYISNIQAAKDYINNFKLANGHVRKITKTADGEQREEITTIPVEEQKRHYLQTHINRLAAGYAHMYAAGYYWIGKFKAEQDGELFDIVELSDFSGIEPELVNKYLAYVDSWAGNDFFANYYYIARYALSATTEELNEIETPPLFKDAGTARDYAERYAVALNNAVQKKLAELGKSIEAETVEEREQARQEIKKDDAEKERIPIPEDIALIGSRDVWASVNGTNITERGVIPISRVIELYGGKHDLPNGVTPYVIEKTISGLNMLQRFNHDAPVNGWFNFETNITEFSKLCGYEQANGEEMKAILTALSILHNLYLIVWKPKGRVAINLLTIPEIGVEGELKGRFKLQVNAEALKGHQNFITMGEIRKMQKETKGQAKMHFNSQIIAKGRKEENALLNEVFGYETMLFEATGNTGDERANPEAVRNVKEYIRKHKTRDRNQVIKWFGEYVDNGILEHWSRTKNTKGEYIYTWRRFSPEKEEPEEQ